MTTKLSRVAEAIVRKHRVRRTSRGRPAAFRGGSRSDTSRERRHDPEGACGPCALRAHIARARPRNVRPRPERRAGPRALPALSRRRRQRSASYVHIRSLRRMRRKGPWSDFLGERRASSGSTGSINVGGRLELYSEFWLRKDDFARLGDINRRALEKNLRELLDHQLAFPDASRRPVDPVRAAAGDRCARARPRARGARIRDGAARLYASRPPPLLPVRVLGPVFRAPRDRALSPSGPMGD